jgi:predicted dehydrogenase
MSRPRLLLVSLGAIGRRHLRNARTLSTQAEIAVLRRPQSVGTAPPDAADHLFTDIEEAAAFAPDLAIVSCPATERPAVAARLFDAGAHLFLEKPVAASSDALEPLTTRAAAEPGRVVRIGYDLRFTPILAAARHLIAEGSLGEVRLARAEVGQYLPDWRPQDDYRVAFSARADLGGGAILELSHEIDLVLWLFGAPNGVTAVADRVGDLEIDVEDCATLALDYVVPRRSVIVQMDFLQRAPRRRLLAIGSEATLEVDLIAETALLQRPGAGPELVAPLVVDEQADGFLRQFDALFAETLDGYRARYRLIAAGCRLDEAVLTLRVADAAKRSAAEARRVTLD